MSVARVPNGGLCATESTISKEGSSCRLVQLWCSGRARTTSRFQRSDVMAEVRRRGCTEGFVCDNCQFVVDSLTDRKPVKPVPEAAEQTIV